MAALRVGQQIAQRSGLSVSTLRLLQHGAEHRLQNRTLAALSTALGLAARPPDDPAVAALLERIAVLETASCRSAVGGSGEQWPCRLRRAETRSPVAGPPAAPALREVGRRGWLRRSGNSGPTYQGLGRRIEQLLALAEEQAGDVVTTAQHDANQILAAAVEDAAKIRAARL
jgi:hypothetical protein